MKIGMPGQLYLEQFGSLVWDYFGTPPYLVGSALTTRPPYADPEQSQREPRDVDVRLILTDEAYEHFCGPYIRPERRNAKWCALCMAFAALGERITELPIDFQIQRQSDANKKYPGHREALGIVAHRYARDQ